MAQPFNYAADAKFVCGTKNRRQKGYEKRRNVTLQRNSKPTAQTDSKSSLSIDVPKKKHNFVIDSEASDDIVSSN